MNTNNNKEIFFNPGLATISFRCKHSTLFGQQLKVVGNIEELGSWEPAKSMNMTTNKDLYPIWESSQEITCPVGMEIYYKYAVYDPKKNNYFWESLESINRHFVITLPGHFFLNDEQGHMNCEVKRIGGTNAEKCEGPDFEQFNEEGEVPNFKIFENDVYNSLSYDSNQLNANDLNETFLFCLNQKISTEDRIIIASAHLPFEIDKMPDDSFKIRTTDESLIYSILYGMKEKGLCEVVWVGMLKNFRQFSEVDLDRINDELRENNIYMINVSETEYKNYWIYMNKILGSVFVESTVDIHNTYFLNYEDYFNSFLAINRQFGDVIHNIMHENDLIMINDVHLMFIPNSLLQKNTNARVGIYFHMAFPSSDVIKTFPYHQEILKSILLCDVIGFHVFQFARNFLTALKRIFGIFFEIKFRGFITLNYLGRYIIVRIMHAGIDVDYVKTIVQQPEFAVSVEKYKAIIQGKFSLVSIDHPNEMSGLLLKMEAYKKFLEKNPEMRNSLVLLQVIKYEDIEEKGLELLEHLNKIVKDIRSKFGNDVVILEESLKFSVPERFALFSLGNVLYFLQSREGNCMYANEYIALQDIVAKEKLNFGIIISENIGVSSAIKGAIRVNPYNIHAITNAIEKVYFMEEEERRVKFQKDLEYVEQNTTFSWIKNFFIDLKRTSTNQTSTKIGIGMGLNYRLMKLNSNFQHLNKLDLMTAYRASERRLIFMDYEGTLQASDNLDDPDPKGFAPTPRLLKLLTALSNDPKNRLFIVSGREEKYLSEWFASVPNLGLAAEHGFFYKYPKNMGGPDNSDEFKHLVQIKDWSWKDSVLKILQGFTEKTEGSLIVKKEAILSWFYRDCDVYFGHIQANEINTHLQNIFENCKLDIVNGKGYVEIKPRNVNKGFFISHMIKNEFIEGNDPDFIFAIGDDTSDEEMFKYLNSVSNQLQYFKDNIKVFSCTIGKKPSSAKCFLNEVPEVLEYFESLNQASNSKFDQHTNPKSTNALSKDMHRASSKSESFSGIHSLNFNI